MKLVTYRVEHKIRVGLVSEDHEWVFPIESIGPEYKTMLEAIRQMTDSEKQTGKIYEAVTGHPLERKAIS